MKKIQVIFVFFFFKLTPSIAATQTYTIQWQSSLGTLTTTTGTLTIADENGKRAIFIQTKAPIAFQQANYSEEGDSTKRVEFPKDNLDKSLLLLSQSTGQILFKTNDQTSLFNFKMIGQPPTFIVDESCETLKVKYKLSGPKTTSYPGSLSCTLKNNEVVSVIFSSTTDANWLGSSIRISEGKGDRWKLFSGSDVTAQDHWALSWGQLDQRNTVKLNFKQNQTAVPSENQLLKFRVGLDYNSGSASKSTSDKSSFSEFRLPLHAELSLGESNIYFVFNGYLPLTNLKKLNEREASISSYEIASGYRWKRNNFQLSSELGYLFHTLSLAGIGVSSSYAAPFIGGKAQYTIQKTIYSLDLQYSNTSSDGTFTEKIMKFTINPSFLKGRTRIYFQTNSITSSKNNIDLFLNRNGMGIAYDF